MAQKDWGLILDMHPLATSHLPFYHLITPITPNSCYLHSIWAVITWALWTISTASTISISSQGCTLFMATCSAEVAFPTTCSTPPHSPAHCPVKEAVDCCSLTIRETSSYQHPTVPSLSRALLPAWRTSHAALPVGPPPLVQQPVRNT